LKNTVHIIISLDKLQQTREKKVQKSPSSQPGSV
jgi:hypothetical protein